MPGNVFEQLDKSPKDQNVDVKEIQDALKEGFFDNKNNRDALKNEFTDKPEWAISELAKTFDRSLEVAKIDITQKIKSKAPLTLGEMKILKLDLMIEKRISYENIDFASIDWKNDVNIRSFITGINPLYGESPGALLKSAQKSINDANVLEEKNRPIAKTLKNIKEKGVYTYQTLDALFTSELLWNESITEITFHESELIQEIFQKTINNTQNGIDETLTYMWKFVSTFSQDKRSNKKGDKAPGSDLAKVNDQVGIRAGCINGLYDITQEKYFTLFSTDEGTAKTNLFNLCEIMTGKGIYANHEATNDSPFLNYGYAENILKNMMYLNGTMGKVLEKKNVDVLGIENSDLAVKTLDDMITEFCDILPVELFLELGFGDVLNQQNIHKKGAELTPLTQSKMIVLKAIIAGAKKLDTQGKQDKYSDAYKKKIIDIGSKTSAKQSEILVKMFENTSGKSESFWKGVLTAKDYGLSGIDARIFDFYSWGYIDNFWAGHMSWETGDKVMGYAKAGYSIGAAAVTMMIFPPAGVGLVGSAIAIGTVSTILNQILYTKLKYDSVREGVKDIGSQWVFDTGTAFLSMRFFGPIMQKIPGFWGNVKNITQNLGMATIDFGTGMFAEGGRQMVLGQQTNFAAMVETGGIMAAIFLVVGGGLHVKSPELHFKTKLKLADEAIKYMELPENKNKFIAEHSETEYADAYALLKQQKKNLEGEILKIEQAVRTKVKSDGTGDNHDIEIKKQKQKQKANDMEPEKSGGTEKTKSVQYENQNNKTKETATPEQINETVLKESIDMETYLNVSEKETGSFTEKVSNFTAFVTKISAYTESLKKMIPQKNVLVEKTNAIIKSNLQKAKDILLIWPKNITKEMKHIKGEMVAYAGAYKNVSGFLLKSSQALGILRTALHPLTEAWHKIHDVETLVHGTYNREESMAVETIIKSINVGLLELESGLIKFDAKIKTNKIGAQFEAQVNKLDLMIDNPAEYVSSLYDIMIEHPTFGYTAQDMQQIKDKVKDVKFNEPISLDIHNEIIGFLITNIKIQTP